MSLKQAHAEYLVMSAKRAHAEYLVMSVKRAHAEHTLERENKLAVLEEEQKKQIEATNIEKREIEEKKQLASYEIHEKDKLKRSYL